MSFEEKQTLKKTRRKLFFTFLFGFASLVLLIIGVCCPIFYNTSTKNLLTPMGCIMSYMFKVENHPGALLMIVGLIIMGSAIVCFIFAFIFGVSWAKVSGAIDTPKPVAPVYQQPIAYTSSAPAPAAAPTPVSVAPKPAPAPVVPRPRPTPGLKKS